MNRGLLVRPEAEEDIAQAFTWYSDRYPGLGENFLESLDDTIEAIGSNPKLYPRIYGRFRRALLRRYPYGVFYVESKERVTVFAVLHSARNPELWVKRFKRLK